MNTLILLIFVEGFKRPLTYYSKVHVKMTVIGDTIPVVNLTYVNEVVPLEKEGGEQTDVTAILMCQ